MATRYQVTASRNVAASAARVYDIISDYRSGHPNILPSNFLNLHVERGGRGAGTVITFDVRAFGQTQSFRHTVEEPEPGRVLVERDTAGPHTTMFVVDRGATEREARVTITSDMTTTRSGLLGTIERAMSSAFLKRLYDKELAKLEAFVSRPLG